MKSIIENIFGFLYTLSMGDYIFLTCTFLLILGLIYITFLIKRDDTVGTYYNESDISDLASIKEKIEKDYKPSAVKLTDYEEEQEKNAIISYEELLKNTKNNNVSYDENYVSNTEEISIKKINLNSNSDTENINSNLKVKLMSYDKEEAFLTALKQLQQNLSN